MAFCGAAAACLLIFFRVCAGGEEADQMDRSVVFVWDVGSLMRVWAETMAYEGACAKDLAPVSARTFPLVH